MRKKIIIKKIKIIKKTKTTKVLLPILVSMSLLIGIVLLFPKMVGIESNDTFQIKGDVESLAVSCIKERDEYKAFIRMKYYPIQFYTNSLNQQQCHLLRNNNPQFLSLEVNSHDYEASRPTRIHRIDGKNQHYFEMGIFHDQKNWLKLWVFLGFGLLLSIGIFVTIKKSK